MLQCQPPYVPNGSVTQIRKEKRRKSLIVKAVSKGKALAVQNIYPLKQPGSPKSIATIIHQRCTVKLPAKAVSVKE